MKTAVKASLFAFVMLVMATAYSQSIPGKPIDIVRPIRIWMGPQRINVLENGAFVIYCENINSFACAATFRPAEVRESNPWIGENNTVIALYDLPQMPDKPRYVIVGDPIMEQPVNQGVQLTCYPPSN